jgi:hypothetical protein
VSSVVSGATADVLGPAAPYLAVAALSLATLPFVRRLRTRSAAALPAPDLRG